MSAFKTAVVNANILNKTSYNSVIVFDTLVKRVYSGDSVVIDSYIKTFESE